MACGGKWALMVVVFPNASYIVTDLVHLTARSSRYYVGNGLDYKYWYDLIVLLMFVWTGLLLGFVHVSAPGGHTSKIGKCGIMGLCIGRLCVGKLRCLARQGLPTQQLGCTN